jgi:hypothetical protein
MILKNQTFFYEKVYTHLFIIGCIDHTTKKCPGTELAVGMAG